MLCPPLELSTTARPVPRNGPHAAPTAIPFGACRFQPAKGAAQVWEAERLDVTRASLEAFAIAAQGGAAFPITLDEMMHGASVTEAVVRSAASGAVEKVA